MRTVVFVLFKEPYFYAGWLPITPRCASRGQSEQSSVTPLNLCFLGLPWREGLQPKIQLSERVRIELLNYQMKVFLARKERDQAITYLEEAAKASFSLEARTTGATTT
jgi:hypothetical protein